MRNRYLTWLAVRVVTPITWFASSVFITRHAVGSACIEFALGAAVLLVYAIVVDWPGRRRFSSQKVPVAVSKGPKP